MKNMYHYHPDTKKIVKITIERAIFEEKKFEPGLLKVTYPTTHIVKKWCRPSIPTELSI